MLLRLGQHTLRTTPFFPVYPLSNIQKRCYLRPVSLLEDLKHRGLIQDVTRPQELQEALETKHHVVYAGVDPTAKSLHIGHLIPLMCLLHFQIRGHKIIPLIGGATGRVGDPSGRLIERQPASAKQVEDNVISLTEGVQKFFSRARLYADSRMGVNLNGWTDPAVTSNLQWHKGVTLLDFLQKVGFHARVNTMLNRESVRARLSSQQGLSFTEFTYQLLQAYDFYHLYKHFGCSIQVGGSDQWGNILAGLELIDRIEQANRSTESLLEAFGLTTPLLTTSTGEKFGKSAGNAIWLDPDLTSVFDFYQYFMKVADAETEHYLNLFTLLSRSEISETMDAHMKQPEKRIAQRRLAAEVTEMIHMREGLAYAQTLTDLLFESDYCGLDAKYIISTFENDPRLVKLDEEEFFTTPVAKLAARYGLVSSISAARMLVQSHGLYLNNRTVPEIQSKITRDKLIDGGIAILRAGKGRLLILALNTSTI